MNLESDKSRLVLHEREDVVREGADGPGVAHVSPCSTEEGQETWAGSASHLGRRSCRRSGSTPRWGCLKDTPTWIPCRVSSLEQQWIWRRSDQYGRGLGSYPVLVARDWRLSGLCLWGKRSGSCSMGFRVSLSSSDSTVEIPNKDLRHFWPGSVELNWLTMYFPYRGQKHVRTPSSLSWQWSSPWSSQGAVCVQNLKTWRSSHSQLFQKTLEHC